MAKEVLTFCVTPKEQPGILWFEHLQSAKGTVLVPVLCWKSTERRSTLYLPDWSDKPVPSPGNGLDEPVAVSIIPKNLSQHEDVLTQITLFHKAVRPED